jgi:hypothetical protein
MQYSWLAVEPDEPFPTERLRPRDVPPPLIRSRDFDAVQLVNRFAHTFNGYDWAGSLEELGDRYQHVHRSWLGGDILPDDVDTLRSLLFFWFRADRHGGGYGPNDEDLVWLTALLDAMRRALAAAEAARFRFQQVPPRSP